MIGGLTRDIRWVGVDREDPAPPPYAPVLIARLYRSDISPDIKQTVSFGYYAPKDAGPAGGADRRSALWRCLATREVLTGVTHWAALPNPPLLAQQEGTLEAMGIKRTDLPDYL